MRGMRLAVNPFIRAHGHTAGPLMRPVFAGMLAGLIGFLPAILTFSLSERNVILSLLSFRHAFWALAFCLASGALYGTIFRRAANDRFGSWLFGASFGFIVWMVDPVIWLPYLGLDPVFRGDAALWFMLSHVVLGGAIGLSYPWASSLTSRRLDSVVGGR